MLPYQTLRRLARERVVFEEYCKSGFFEGLKSIVWNPESNFDPCEEYSLTVTCEVEFAVTKIALQKHLHFKLS